METCSFCNSKFATKANLRFHQTTAKYCLDKQNVDIINFSCSGCSKTFTTKPSLDRHLQSCVKFLSAKKIIDLENQINFYEFQLSEKDKQLNDKTYEISKKDEQIKELQDKLENIALKALSRPTTTTVNNNTTNNVNAYIQQMDVITDQIFEDNLENFNIEYIKKGAEGFANYALEHPLHNRIACVDYSRKKVKYKDENGNIISDPEMTKLSTKLFSSILAKNRELITKYVDEVTFSSLDPEDKMRIMVDMTDNMFLVKRGAEGEKHQLYDAFLKNICSKTLVR